MHNTERIRIPKITLCQKSQVLNRILKVFSGFRGGSACGSYNRGGRSGGIGGHCHTGAGQFAYFQCQVCFKFGHTAVFVAIAMINIINQILP